MCEGGSVGNGRVCARLRSLQVRQHEVSHLCRLLVHGSSQGSNLPTSNAKMQVGLKCVRAAARFQMLVCLLSFNGWTQRELQHQPALKKRACGLVVRGNSKGYNPTVHLNARKHAVWKCVAAAPFHSNVQRLCAIWNFMGVRYFARGALCRYVAVQKY